MKNHEDQYFATRYRSGRNIALAIYVILTSTFISAYTVIQLLQGV